MAEHTTETDTGRKEEEEDYNSASDDDFAPDALPADDAAESSSSSSSEDEGEDDAVEATDVKKTKTRKTSFKTRTKTKAEDLDFDNSGDEATIQKGMKRKKRKLGDVEEDEGGEGGLIKTRAQRRAEGISRKPLQAANTSSLDVDALFAQMVSQKPTPRTEAQDTPSSSSAKPPPFPLTQTQELKPDTTTTPQTNIAYQAHIPPTVTIKRIYVFAGETQTEERSVPADSEEARLYLAQQQQATSASIPSTSTDTTITTTNNPPLRRPTKRKSVFATGATSMDTTSANAAPTKGPKLNTLEKSKLDWAAQVDREGISDELSEARKAKGTYLGRMDFLGRMDMKREEELRGGAKGR